MATMMELLQESRKLRGHAPQMVSTGVIASFDSGRWRVVSGQTTYLAASGIAQELKKGDRVYIIQNRGITKIVGLLGADESV
jgi:uncharacterized cupin superfamily protein